MTTIDEKPLEEMIGPVEAVSMRKGPTADYDAMLQYTLQKNIEMGDDPSIYGPKPKTREYMVGGPGTGSSCAAAEVYVEPADKDAVDTKDNR